MLAELKTGNKVVGIKQSQRAVAGGNAAEAFVAGDCDARIRAAFTELCASCGVPLVSVPTMAELGAACGIQVGAAAAALLR
jgi:large subunit ribosomal protein L7A